MNLQQALPPEAHTWAANIHVNPALTTADRIALDCFFGFAVILGAFVFTNAFNAYARQKLGWRCLWCRKVWIGRGCGCNAEREFKVGGDKSLGSEAWQELDLDERLYHRARHSHKKLLESREAGGRHGDKYYWLASRNAYLIALRECVQCRKRGIYR